MRAFLGEGFVDHPQGGSVNSRTSDHVQPMSELCIQVIEIAEGSRQEEAFQNVTEWPLDVTLGLCTIGLAGLRVKAVMACQIDRRSIIDDGFRRTFADDSRLHPIIAYLPWHAANGFESQHIATQYRWQDETAVSEHHGKQPDDPWRRRLVSEDDMELGEVDLCLLARRRLEAGL